MEKEKERRETEINKLRKPSTLVRAKSHWDKLRQRNIISQTHLFSPVSSVASPPSSLPTDDSPLGSFRDFASKAELSKMR